MKHPCEIVVRYLLPACRSLIAKELIEHYGFTQISAAEKLGTTQAAISQYLSSKRGEKRKGQFENNPPIKLTISKIVNGIASGNLSSIDVMTQLCDLCMSLRNNDLICTMHKDDVSFAGTCKACIR